MLLLLQTWKRKDNMRYFNRITLIIVVMIAIGFVFTACDPGDADKPDIDGTIEETYAATGPYDVTSTSTADYKIFYPSRMDGNHPIITWGNGTGAPTFSYTPTLQHLASWGFVVVASNSSMTQSGKEMVGGIDYLIKENSRSGSIFYKMLDADKIGSTGHSQGGGGAINAAKDDRVTCTAPLAPSPAQIQKVKCPIFLVAGSADNIVSANMVRFWCYTPAEAPTIFGIIQGANHFTFAGNGGQSRGYVTAWFRYHLQDDQVAQKAFENNVELFDNPKWKAEKKNF
jgi:predicted dienelactone hydrolase